MSRFEIGKIGCAACAPDHQKAAGTDRFNCSDGAVLTSKLAFRERLWRHIPPRSRAVYRQTGVWIKSHHPHSSANFFVAMLTVKRGVRRRD